MKDWTELLEGPSAAELASALRSLPFDRVQRIPPPKTTGLPLGHELRILSRYLRAESSTLDPSGLSRVYQALARPGDRLLYRALILGEATPEAGWRELIGREEVISWTAQGLLEPAAEGQLRSRFLVVSLRDLLLVVDPPVPAVGPRVYIGQDSLLLYEFLERGPIEGVGRALDVGTGSGVILLANARRSRGSVAVELNARAARVARFNSRLNELPCDVREGDIFEVADSLGAFDLVTWNLPFVFLPEGLQSLDGYGGHLGIELTVRFVEILPRLLTARGRSILYTTAPVLRDGSNALMRELEPRLGPAGLDASITVLQWYWSSGAVGELHREHGIDHIETVILRIRAGTGRLEREERPWSVRITDRIRGALQRAWSS